MTEQARSDVHGARTLGAPTPGDPRDGELHQFPGQPPAAFDLEPWDGAEGVNAHYVRDEGPPSIEDDGRTVWRYVYTPQ